jgi:regulatory protein YycI of two-component signal transduction system YycFG
MDWGKAKNIFIVSFLVLNIILSYQLWLGRDQQIETVQLTKSRKDELNQMLRTKDIRLEGELRGELPKEAPDLNFLYVQVEKRVFTPNDTTNPIANPLEFNPPLPVEDPLKAEGVIEALKDFVPFKRYQVDYFLSGESHFVFHQLEQGVPLFPSSLEVIIEDGSITAIHQQALKVLSRGSDRKVVSAFTAVRTLAESYLPNHSQIVDIQIGYHGQQYNSDVQVLAPVWRVALKEGGIYYVNAITGVVDTPKTSDSGIKPE